jgi:hypothetical protein
VLPVEENYVLPVDMNIPQTEAPPDFEISRSNFSEFDQLDNDIQTLGLVLVK